MKAALIIPIMIAFAAREAPAIKDKDNKKAKKWRDSISQIAKINEEVAKRAVLTGNVDVDAALIKATAYRESRWKTYTPGGDCWKSATGVKHCPAKGVMQIMASNRHIFPKIPETRKDPVIKKLLEKQDGKITLANLKDPEINIRLGYIQLHRWKNLCGGAPVVWLTSYRYGRCTKSNTGDSEGRKRCKIATNLLKKAKKLPKDWSCLPKPKKKK